MKTRKYQSTCDSKDNDGQIVFSDTYFYTLDVNGKTATKKAIIME